MSSTSLVTNGYICYGGQPIPVPQPASLDTPAITGAVEVRPRIRRVLPPEPADVGPPTVTSAQELKPQVRGRVTPDPEPPVRPPTVRTAQELKPTIVKVEEED